MCSKRQNACNMMYAHTLNMADFATEFSFASKCYLNWKGIKVLTAVSWDTVKQTGAKIEEVEIITGLSCLSHSANPLAAS